MSARWTLIRAAAGTGKTTTLVQRYLGLLRDGREAPRMVAITFTRKAAGELIERVSDVLWSVLLEEHGDPRPQARAARRRLADDYRLYAPHAPTSREAVERALASLGGAPVGTIDSFVQWLLSEMPLDAAYPLPDGSTVPLDAPLGAGGDPTALLEEAARSTMLQWGEADDPRLTRLTGAFTLAELRALAVQTPSSEPPTPTADLLRSLDAALIATFAEEDRGEGLKTAAREVLALVVPGAVVARQAAEAAGLPPDAPEREALLAWMDQGGAAPAALETLWPLFCKRAEGLKAHRWPAAAGRAFAEALAAAGFSSVEEAFRAATGIKSGLIDAATLAKHVGATQSAAVPAAIAWLADPQGDPPPAVLDAASGLNKTAKARRAVREVVDGLHFTAEAYAHTLGLGGQPPHDQLRAMLTTTVSAGAALEHIEGQLLSAVKPLAASLHRWLSTPQEAPPPGLACAVAGLGAASRARAIRRLWSADADQYDAVARTLLAAQVAGGQVRVPLSSLRDLLEGGFANPDTWPALDALRAAVHDLQGATWQAGMAAAAQQGALDYAALLTAARSLCEAAARDPDHRLHDRFQALLVDEAQDSSPAQFDFYAALLAACPNAAAVAVGDIRQSIYGFRDAEPQGLLQLVGETEDLLVNYRSVPPLVAAQRALFGPPLDHALGRRGLANVQDLSSLTADDSGDEGAGRPVTLVTGAPFAGQQALDPAPKQKDVDAAALRAFSAHLQARWAAGLDESAAVLAPTWRIAKSACALLRSWLGPDDQGRPRVWLESGREWRTGRVVRDLRILLTALLDHSQHLAWVGLWKHPMVGLSDRALALASRRAGLLGAGDGEMDPWLGQPGWMVRLGGLTEPHDPRDVVAFARARGPLQTALNSLPRQGAAATLEALSVALDWRTVLAASPDPDAVTHLDLALDWLRDLEASGVSVREMVERLGTEDDPPRLNLDRPAPAVSCMTVFGAKGLAWDHVLVASVGKHASSASAKSLGLDVGGQTLQLLPLRLDPDGALDPKHDPHGALSKLIQRQRQHEECVRLAYVGLTRARETAWCALPPASSNAVVAALVDAWGPGDPDATPEQAPAGVTWLPYTPAPGADAPSPQRVVATGSPMPPAPVAPAPWRLRSPSSLHTHSGPARRAALVESVLTRVIATGSHHAGLDDFLESPARFAEAGAARSLGDIAHAWLAAWSFDAVSPTNERAVQFLRDEWAMEDAETAAWLIQLSDRIRRDADNPLLARVHSEGVQRFAEWPLLAPASVGGSSPLLLNGTADLVLRDPGAPPAERWTILDFKAGKAPDLTPGFDRAVAARDAKLKTYAPQLEGYREALEAAIQTRPEWAGEGVGAVGLWFVRRGAALWWSQTQPASSPSQPPSAS